MKKLVRLPFEKWQNCRFSKSIHKLVICWWILLTITVLFSTGCGGLFQFHKSRAGKEIIPPTIISQSPLIYPKEAIAQGLEGNVGLEVLVSETGDVLDAKIERSSHSPILDKAALEHAKTLKFRPALKNNKPIAIWTKFDVKYRLAEKKFKNLVLYADAIRDLYNKAESVSPKIRGKYAERAYPLLEQFLLKNNVNPEQFNEVIKSFVRPTVYEEWKSFGEEWPFRFLIFHDFYQRFPKEETGAKARQTLLGLLNTLIDEMENPAFLSQLKHWLARYYPNSDFSKVAEKLEKRLERLQK